MRSRLKSSVNARRVVEIAIDTLLVGLAWYLAFQLRFDQTFPDRYKELLEDTIVFVVVGKVAFFAAFGLYNRLWRFVDQRDFESIVRAVVVTSLVLVGTLFLITPNGTDPPRGVIAIDFLLTLLFVAGSRFLARASARDPPTNISVSRKSIATTPRGGSVPPGEIRNSAPTRTSDVTTTALAIASKSRWSTKRQSRL